MLVVLQAKVVGDWLCQRTQKYQEHAGYAQPQTFGLLQLHMMLYLHHNIVLPNTTTQQFQ